MIEHRVRTGVEVRADGSDGRKWWVRLVPYMRRDSYWTKFAPITAERAMERSPKFLWGHNYADLNQLVGRAEDVDVTGDSADFLFRLADFDRVPSAKIMSGLLADGIVDAFSVGFERLDDRPDPEEDGVTVIADWVPIEGSGVVDAAVPDTGLIGAARARLREGGAAVAAQTLADVAELLRRGAVTPEQAKALLADTAVLTVAVEGAQEGSGAAKAAQASPEGAEDVSEPQGTAERVETDPAVLADVDDALADLADALV